MEKGFVKWLEMSEREYRASRLCRVLGNPKVYKVLKILKEKKVVPFSKLVRILKRSKSTVSIYLQNLKNLDLVSYRRKKGETTYWIKSVKLNNVLEMLEDYVQFVGRRIY